MSDIVRVKLENGSEASAGRSYAELVGLEILDKPAVDARGVALDAKHKSDINAITVTGAKLNAALEGYGLSTSGRVVEKQQRLADHEASLAAAGGAPSDPNDPGADDAPDGGDIR